MFAQTHDTRKSNVKSVTPDSPIINVVTPTAPENKTSNAYVKDDSNKEKTLDVCMVIATWILAFIAFWQAMITRVSAQRQLRAYITVNPSFEFFDHQNSRRGDKFKFTAKIRNCGQTPAYEVSCGHSVSLLPYPLPKKYPLVADYDLDTSVITLAPNQESTLFFEANKYYQPNEVRAMKLSENQRLFIYGKIIYKDIFKKKRFTSFCYLLEWNGNIVDKFEFTNENNEAD